VALGNSYPAIQLDDRGEQVDSGVVIQFTDDTEQPGSGGGGSQGVNASLRASSGVGQNDAAAIIRSGIGNIFANVGGWVIAAAMGQVAALADISYLLAGTVPSTNDPFDVLINASVLDATGANQASVSGGFSVPSPVTDLTSTNTLTGGTWLVNAGVDLTVAGDILSSTAGGAFFITVQVLGNWD
jgi:hypothetical protein